MAEMIAPVVGPAERVYGGHITLAKEMIALAVGATERVSGRH